MDYVKGYTIANDVTVRDRPELLYRPSVKAKGFRYLRGPASGPVDGDGR